MTTNLQNQLLMKKLKKTKRRSLEGHIHVLTTNRLNSSERTYKAYTLLLRLVPRLKEMLEDSSIETDVFDGFIAQVRYIPDEVCVSLNLNVFCSFKKAPTMHAVTMSGA